MATTLRDHKMLWGRSGSRCAMPACRVRLIEPGGSSGHGGVVLGEEAHIVGKSTDGPRGSSPLTAAQRDSYSNLILLCPTHHALIDSDTPSYPPAALLALKSEHEAWVAQRLDFDAAVQLSEELWAELLDVFNTRAEWDRWNAHISPLLTSRTPRLHESVHVRLHDLSEWLFLRVWPQGHELVRDTLTAYRQLLNDLLATFDSDRDDVGNWAVVRLAYKIDRWDPPLYERLFREHQQHVALIEDLALELTRYANLVADLIRSEFDPRFRFDEGRLSITRGPDQALRYYQYVPEFSDDQRPPPQPYSRLSSFTPAVRRARDMFSISSDDDSDAGEDSNAS